MWLKGSGGCSRLVWWLWLAGSGGCSWLVVAAVAEVVAGCYNDDHIDYGKLFCLHCS